MDVLSILGAFLGVLAIVGGNLLEGGQVSNLFNGAAAVI
ncbi:MAG: flagellar motor protein, partial [Gammaproteobacteria bacterium]